MADTMCCQQSAAGKNAAKGGTGFWKENKGRSVVGNGSSKWQQQPNRSNRRVKQ